jgi:hypothetical protein
MRLLLIGTMQGVATPQKRTTSRYRGDISKAGLLKLTRRRIDSLATENGA